MQLSGESNNQDLSSQTLFKLGGLTTTEYALKDQVRAMNEAQKKIWTKIFQAYGWQYDDNNQTGTPVSTASLSTNSDISMPSGALTIKGVEITTGSVTTQLIPISFEEIRQKEAFGEFEKTDGIPKYYCPMGDQILLKPQLASGTYTYSVYYDRGSVAFAYNGTAVEPGFATEFHDALAVYAALEFAKSRPNGMGDRIRVLMEDWNNYMFEIEKFYGKRWTDKPKRLQPLTQDNR